MLASELGLPSLQLQHHRGQPRHEREQRSGVRARSRAEYEQTASGWGSADGAGVSLDLSGLLYQVVPGGTRDRAFNSVLRCVSTIPDPCDRTPHAWRE